MVGETLSEGTAAQIIRAYGESEVQVNDAIPPAFWHAVATHCLEQHQDGCYVTHCFEARNWLPAILSVTANVSA